MLVAHIRTFRFHLLKPFVLGEAPEILRGRVVDVGFDNVLPGLDGKWCAFGHQLLYC